jgi:hypothetical protein
LEEPRECKDNVEPSSAPAGGQQSGSQEQRWTFHSSKSDGESEKKKKKDHNGKPELNNPVHDKRPPFTFEKPHSTTSTTTTKVQVVSDGKTEEDKALKILETNSALAIDKEQKTEISNDIINPENFSFRTENGKIFDKMNIVAHETASNIFSGTFCVAYLYVIFTAVLEVFGLNQALMLLLFITTIASVVIFGLKKRPVVEQAVYVSRHETDISSEYVTNVSIEYVQPDLGESHMDERSVMTRLGKIDHKDPQLWDVKITEEYLRENDTMFDLPLTYPFHVETKERTVKVSLELIANTMALKTLNTDDTINVLRLKMKQSMGNINCVNISRSLSLSNHFVQSNSLEIALFQLRAVRQGADFRLSH